MNLENGPRNSTDPGIPGGQGVRNELQELPVTYIISASFKMHYLMKARNDSDVIQIQGIARETSISPRQ